MADRRSGSEALGVHATDSKSPAEPHRDEPLTWTAWLALAVIFVVWGTTFLAMRVAVTHIPPFPMSGSRLLAAGLILAIMAVASGTRTLPSRLSLQRYVFSGIAMYVGGNGVLSYAIQFVPTSVAALLIGTIPLWMVAIAVVLGRIRPKPVIVVGVLVGMGGAALVADPRGPFEVWPVALILLSALSWAAGSLFSGHDVPKDGPLAVVAIQMLVGGSILLAVSIPLGQLSEVDVMALPAAGWLAMVWLVVPVGVATALAYAYSLRRFPTELVAMYPFVNTVVAVALGWLILGEQLPLQAAVGSVVILASAVVVVVKSPLRRAPTP